MRISIDTATDGRNEAEHAIAILGAFYQLGDSKIHLTGTPPTTMAAALAAQHVHPHAPEITSGPDNTFTIVERNPAEVFGVPGNIPPVAPLAAVATAPQNALVVPPVTSTPPAPDMQPPAAPPAPPAVAPTASAPPAPPPASVPASGVELDADGLPWDARIHQSSKGKTQKNVWKMRKGLNDDAMVNRVKAELLAVVAMALPPVAAPQTPAIPTPPAAPVPFVPPVAPSPPAPPVAPSAPAGPSAPSTVVELMPRITSAMTAGLLPNAAIGWACGVVGLPNLMALNAAPDLVPKVWETLLGAYPEFAAANPS